LTKTIEGYFAVLFQFLVGTLKTKGADYSNSDEALVSIPRRYAKNDIALGDVVTMDYEFQFLVGTLKTPHLPW